MGNLDRWDLSNLATGYICANFRFSKCSATRGICTLIAFCVNYNKSNKPLLCAFGVVLIYVFRGHYCITRYARL